jgi:hypothetical protein
MFARSRAVLVAALIAGAAPVAGAQATTTAAFPSDVAVSGPSRAASTSAVRAQRQAISREDALRSASAQGTLGRGEVLMIVGGAALITGLIIGDDAGTLIAVGGAVIGLYGLYLWLPTR